MGDIDLNFSSVRSILPFSEDVEISSNDILMPVEDNCFCASCFTSLSLNASVASWFRATFSLSCASAASLSLLLCSLVFSPMKFQIPCCLPSSSSIAFIFSETTCIWSIGRFPLLKRSCNWALNPCK